MQAANKTLEDLTIQNARKWGLQIWSGEGMHTESAETINHIKNEKQKRYRCFKDRQYPNGIFHRDSKGP